jgi:hypothetical protein
MGEGQDKARTFLTTDITDYGWKTNAGIFNRRERQDRKGKKGVEPAPSSVPASVFPVSCANTGETARPQNFMLALTRSQRPVRAPDLQDGGRQPVGPVP